MGGRVGGTFFYLILLLLAPSLQAQNNVIDQNARGNQEFNPWISGLSYGAQTDLADPGEPRQYTHFLSGYGGYRFSQSASLFLNVNGAFTSIGNGTQQVDVSDDATELILNDVSLSFLKFFRVMKNHNLSLSFNNQFPTSADASREGYLSVTSLGGSYLIPTLGSKLFISLGMRGTYIWNTYEFSQATNFANQQASFAMGLSALLFYWKRFFIGGRIGTQSSMFTDNSFDQSARNSVSTGYRDGHVNVSLSYSNGTYLDEGEARFWYIDQFRQIISLSLGYNF